MVGTFLGTFSFKTERIIGQKKDYYGTNKRPVASNYIVTHKISHRERKGGPHETEFIKQ